MSRIETRGQDALAAMSFVEIGRHLGTSRENAFGIYTRAMKKLRRNPEALENMRALAAEIDRRRPQRFDYLADAEEKTA